MFEDLDIMIWAPIRTQTEVLEQWSPQNLPGIQEPGTPYL